MARARQICARVWLALNRARIAVFLIGCAYALGLILGLVAVHVGHARSLRFRDRMVNNARASSPITRLLSQGRPVAAAALDFGANTLAATATAAGGWVFYAPLPIAVYRGWIGGIVSVDSKHRSRLRADDGGLYYVVVVTLQLLGYTLAGGAGVNLGLARTRRRPEYAGPRFIGVPHEAFRDAAYIYLLVVPVFACASGLEFLWQA